MKRLAAVAVAFLAVFLLGPGVQPAAAAGCTNPIITSPASGLPGKLDPGPASAPAKGDPAYGEKTAAHKQLLDHPRNDYERYGFGGLAWQSHDPGNCDFWSTSLNDVDLGDTGASLISDTMWGLLVGATSVVVAVVRWAFDPGTLGYLLPVQQLAADVFGNVIFKALFGVTIAAGGIYILAKSSAGNVRGAAHSAGWIALVLCAAILATIYPTTLAPQVDKAVTGIVAETSNAVATAGQGEQQSTNIADAIAENLRGGLLYETWLSGTLGRSDGYAADTYGHDLYAAASLTRKEVEETRLHPERADAIYKKHAEAFHNLVKKVLDDEKVDQDTKDTLIGHKKSDRVLAATLGWVGFWCLTLFLLAAALILLFGLVVFRVALMVLPFLALIGGFPPMRKLLIGLFDYTLGALAAAATFGAFATVMAFAMGLMLGPPRPGEARPPWLVTMLLMIVLTVVAWRLSKPMRHVKTFVNVRPRVSKSMLPAPAPGQPGQPYGWHGEDGQPVSAPAAAGAAAYAGAAPAEAGTRTVVGKAALSGAVQGAIGGLAAGVVTGGGATLAGAATGAARGAAVASAGAAGAQITGSATAGAVAATAAGRVAAHHQLPAPAEAAATPAAAPAPAEATQPTPAAPVPPVPAVRFYQPGAASPADDLTPARVTVHDGVPVYSIYTPED